MASIQGGRDVRANFDFNQKIVELLFHLNYARNCEHAVRQNDAEEQIENGNRRRVQRNKVAL